MTTAEVLTRAASLIETVGWGKGGEPETLCIVEAIRGSTRTAVDAVLAYEAVVRQLGIIQHRVTAGEVLIAWNDRKGRTQQEVLDILSATANHIKETL